jgi:hypothetical protein
MVSEFFVDKKAGRFTIDGRLYIQAVVGPALAAPGGGGGVVPPGQNLCDGALKMAKVAADNFVNPEAGVGDFRFANLFVHGSSIFHTIKFMLTKAAMRRLTK